MCPRFNGSERTVELGAMVVLTARYTVALETTDVVRGIVLGYDLLSACV